MVTNLFCRTKSSVRLVATVVSTIAIVGDSTSIAVAEAQTSNDGIPYIADSAETFNQYSDEDLLYFLLAGQGPIADENQELLKSMNFDSNKLHTDEEALDLLINEDVTYSDSFPEIK